MVGRVPVTTNLATTAVTLTGGGCDSPVSNFQASRPVEEVDEGGNENTDNRAAVMNAVGDDTRGTNDKGLLDQYVPSIHDEEKLAAYIELAGPAMRAAGGRFLARGLPANAFESGVRQRTTLIEFDSVAAAVAACQSAAYQEALRVLDDGAERDVRIIEAAPTD